MSRPTPAVGLNELLYGGLEALGYAANQELEPREIRRRRFCSFAVETRVGEQNFWLRSESTLEGHPNPHREACRRDQMHLAGRRQPATY